MVPSGQLVVAAICCFPYLESPFLKSDCLKLFFYVLLLIAASHLNAQDLKPYEQSIPNTSLKFKMVPIPAGKFTMGSNFSETGRE